MEWTGQGGVWQQDFDTDEGNWTFYYGGKDPQCAMQLSDQTASPGVWVCPDIGYHMVAALQFIESNNLQGYIELRDAYDLPAYTDWMTYISDDSLHIGDLSIPGSHDSASNKCPNTSQCQVLGFYDQMTWGVRAFDLRLGLNMEFYHGDSDTDYCDCGYNLDDFLNAVLGDPQNEKSGFLKTHPGEFVIAFVNEEHCSDPGDTYTFNTNFNNSARKYGWNNYVIDKNILNVGIGTLRGKLVLITENEAVGGCGYIAGVPQIFWPSDTTNDNTPDGGCSEGSCISVGVSNCYDHYPTTKLSSGGLLSHLSIASYNDDGRWFIGYTSGYKLGEWQEGKFCDCSPIDYAQGVNPAVWEYLLGGDGHIAQTCPSGEAKNAWGWISHQSPIPAVPPDRKGKMGTVMMDYVGRYNTSDIRDDLIRRNLGY